MIPSRSVGLDVDEVGAAACGVAHRAPDGRQRRLHQLRCQRKEVRLSGRIDGDVLGELDDLRRGLLLLWLWLLLLLLMLVLNLKNRTKKKKQRQLLKLAMMMKFDFCFEVYRHCCWYYFYYCFCE